MVWFIPFLVFLSACDSIQPIAFKGPNGNTVYLLRCREWDGPWTIVTRRRVSCALMGIALLTENLPLQEAEESLFLTLALLLNANPSRRVSAGLSAGARKEGPPAEREVVL